MNFVEAVVYSFCWLLIFVIGFKLYKKQEIKPIIWKAVIVYFIGKFALTFNYPLEQKAIHFALIPLGVIAIYLFFSKRPNFNTYLTFAWFGFFSNYLFLVGTLLIIPLYSFLYDKNDILTYIAHSDNIEILSIHPSANDNIAVRASILEQVKAAKEQPVNIDWYYESVGDDRVEVERFPYILANIAPKWGSQAKATIYVEKDGKGLLIASPTKHLYYRLDESILQEVTTNEEK
ncbi:hypothetical protein NYE67_16150 [Solibacillus sp. FSL W8-0474]|uniref:hypothetical protein n=1 Tax=Solibacillus sp. FSL W8-0474 TaxID=2975336 RepID=UPI0030F7D046